MGSFERQPTGRPRPPTWVWVSLGILSAVTAAAVAVLRPAAMVPDGMAAASGVGAGPEQALSGRGEICRVRGLVPGRAEDVFPLVANPTLWGADIPAVRSVRAAGGGRYRWILAGPAGTDITYDMSVVRSDAERSLTWQTLSGSLITTSGRVDCEPADGGTQVTVEVRYLWPAGLADVAARLACPHPDAAAERALRSVLAALRSTADNDEARPGSAQHLVSAGHGTRSERFGPAVTKAEPR